LENEGILDVFLVFQTEEVGQKDGCGSQTQLRGVAFNKNGNFFSLKRIEIPRGFDYNGRTLK